MYKNIISLVVLISFLSISFCFASDSNLVGNIWNDCLPKISAFWGATLSWIDNSMKPWIEKNIGTKTRQEFEKEFSEAVQDVPNTIKAIWDKITTVF